MPSALFEVPDDSNPADDKATFEPQCRMPFPIWACHGPGWPHSFRQIIIAISRRTGSLVSGNKDHTTINSNHDPHNENEIAGFCTD